MTAAQLADGDGLVAARLAAQGLTGPPALDPVDVVGRLLAVQAQDPRGLRLTIRSRSRALHAADVDRALSADRSLVVTWLNRGTLHLVRAEDYWWLRELTAPAMAAQIRRRLTQEGVSPDAAERGVARIERALTDEGPLSRAELRERVDAAGVPTAGQAMIYLLIVASTRGLVVRGPVVGGEQAYVLVRDWLGPPPRAFDRDAALAELARRYLAGHGPADDRDLARWVGLPLRDARRGLAAVAAELVTRPDGRLDLPRGEGPGLPAPRLLGPFDPVLHGWNGRDWVGAAGRVVTSNGIFRPMILVDGQAAGTWSMPAGRVELAPFTDPPDWGPAVAAALRDEAADVRRFLAPRPA
ncbi:winged helix DNA-binding domain-containing protein [Candidatus Frankia alpina]|uniref:Winged helix DNA-binding domain-containing protein n=1 Tax=Candidatus Frankia alpina TaxID=2699483 RepID=A0A4S5C3N2_9ACTN|nr:winged helix DNA-binding domain-containing protein [Candidatus Frankia alpina]THJ38165.1 winged helix DNA-binding domain-containing protein [Candidatus Frankia alpina]